MSDERQGERGDTGQRGVGGERGPKGDHGQPGDIGVTGVTGPTGPTGATGATGAQGIRGYSTRPGVLVAFVGMFVAFLAASGVSTFWISRNQDVNVAQCREIEKVKKLLRDDASGEYLKLDENLKLLKLDKTPAIVARAKNKRDNTLRRFVARPCKDLPDGG